MSFLHILLSIFITSSITTITLVHTLFDFMVANMHTSFLQQSFSSVQHYFEYLHSFVHITIYRHARRYVFLTLRFLIVCKPNILNALYSHHLITATHIVQNFLFHKIYRRWFDLLEGNNGFSWWNQFDIFKKKLHNSNNFIVLRLADYK